MSDEEFSRKHPEKEILLKADGEPVSFEITTPIVGYLGPKIEDVEDLTKELVLEDDDPEFVRAQVNILKEDYPETFDVVVGIVEEKHAERVALIKRLGEQMFTDTAQRFNDYVVDRARVDYEGSTMYTVDQLAKERVEKSKGMLTEEQAKSEIWMDRPDLYEKWQKEQRVLILTKSEIEKQYKKLNSAEQELDKLALARSTRDGMSYFAAYMDIIDENPELAQKAFDLRNEAMK